VKLLETPFLEIHNPYALGNTIDIWLKRKAATGDFQAKTNKPPRSDRLDY